MRPKLLEVHAGRIDGVELIEQINAVLAVANSRFVVDGL